MSDGITDGYRMREEAERGMEAAGWIRHKIHFDFCMWEDPLNPGQRYFLHQAVEIQEERDAAVPDVMES